MSDDFGKGVKYPDYKVMTEKDVQTLYPDHAHLVNAEYAMLLKDYFACTTKYLNDFYDPAILKK